jgi:hypothetical protein
MATYHVWCTLADGCTPATALASGALKLCSTFEAGVDAAASTVGFRGF